MAVAVENEAGRHRICATSRPAAPTRNLSADERDTLVRGIASHARDAPIFEDVVAAIERARAEFGGDAVWDE